MNNGQEEKPQLPGAESRLTAPQGQPDPSLPMYACLSMDLLQDVIELVGELPGNKSYKVMNRLYNSPKIQLPKQAE